MAGCFDCLALTPFSSLIATIVLAVGLGLYCGCGLVALDKTCDMFTDTFVCCGEAEDTYESEFEQFKSALELSIYIVTPVMAVWAIALLVLSFLSTHKAKVQVYGGEKTSCGGYICNSIFIGFTYIIFLGWLLFAALTLIPLMELLSVLNSIYCFDESYKVDLNLTLYGYPVENFTDSLCDDVITAADDQMKNFCVAADENVLWWSILFGGCCLVVIGLVHFLMSMTANYAYVKAGLKKSDYEDRKYMEEQELNDIANYRSNERIVSAYPPY